MGSIPVFDIFLKKDVNSYLSGNVKDSIVTIDLIDSSVSYLPLNFTLTSGFPENYPMTCSLSGLPTGMTDSPGSFSFKLSYQASIKLFVNADTGLYTVNLNVGTPQGPLVYPFRLRVRPRPASAGFVGSYIGSDPCGHFNYDSVIHVYSTEIFGVSTNPNELSISRIAAGYGVYVYISGYAPYATLTLPLQTTNGVSIYGRGFSTADSGAYAGQPMLFIYDTIVMGTDTQTCMTQIKTHNF